MMARKFFDGSPGFSDPAGGLQTLNAGETATWGAPDAAIKSFDAAGEWTGPELELPVPDIAQLQDATVEQLAIISDAAAKEPDKYYEKYGGQTLTIPFSDSTIGASKIIVRVSDAGNMDRADGRGKCGLWFSVVQGLKIQVMNNSSTTSGGYPASVMFKNIIPKFIAGLPAEWQAKLVETTLHVNIKSSGTTMTPVNSKAHLATMVQWFGEKNLGVSFTSKLTWWKLEESWFRWNQEHDTPTDRIIKNDSGAAYHSWTASVNSTTGFGVVNNAGNPNYDNAYSNRVPSLGFSIGK